MAKVATLVMNSNIMTKCDYQYNKNLNSPNCKRKKQKKTKYCIMNGETIGLDIKYDRASSIIIEKSYNSRFRCEPAIILVHNERWDTFVEPGGRIEKSENNLEMTLIKTAKRELTEETLNSLNISDYELKKSKYIDFNDQKTKLYSRIFVIAIKENMYDENIYYENMDIISKTKVEYAWKETSKIKRFYISDIIECINKMEYEYYEYENVKCINSNDELCNIYYKTIGILKQVISQSIIFDVLLNPRELYLYEFPVSDSVKKFLAGTKTFEIMS